MVFQEVLLSFHGGTNTSIIATPAVLPFSFPVPSSIVLHHISSVIFSTSFPQHSSLSEHFLVRSFNAEPSPVFICLEVSRVDLSSLENWVNFAWRHFFCAVLSHQDLPSPRTMFSPCCSEGCTWGLRGWRGQSEPFTRWRSSVVVGKR